MKSLIVDTMFCKLQVLFYLDSCLHFLFSVIFFVQQGNKMLKTEKWQTIFDDVGKVLGFQKVLKLIILGVSCLASFLLFLYICLPHM